MPISAIKAPFVLQAMSKHSLNLQTKKSIDVLLITSWHVKSLCKALNYDLKSPCSYLQNNFFQKRHLCPGNTSKCSSQSLCFSLDRPRVFKFTLLYWRCHLEEQNDKMLLQFLFTTQFELHRSIILLFYYFCPVDLSEETVPITQQCTMY